MNDLIYIFVASLFLDRIFAIKYHIIKPQKIRYHGIINVLMTSCICVDNNICHLKKNNPTKMVRKKKNPLSISKKVFMFLVFLLWYKIIQNIL